MNKELKKYRDTKNANGCPIVKSITTTSSVIIIPKTNETMADIGNCH